MRNDWSKVSLRNGGTGFILGVRTVVLGGTLLNKSLSPEHPSATLKQGGIRGRPAIRVEMQFTGPLQINFPIRGRN